MSKLSPAETGTGSSAPPRRRSAWAALKTPLTLLVLIAFVAGAAYFGWEALTATPEHTAGGGHHPCQGGGPQRLTAKDVTINVYNATDRSGLAGRTADRLANRGFTIKSVDNDPRNKTIRGVAELRFGPNGRKAAAVVFRHIGHARRVHDKRTSHTVDLVLGNDFHGLVKVDRLHAQPVKAGHHPGKAHGKLGKPGGPGNGGKPGGLGGAGKGGQSGSGHGGHQHHGGKASGATAGHAGHCR